MPPVGVRVHSKSKNFYTYPLHITMGRNISDQQVEINRLINKLVTLSNAARDKLIKKLQKDYKFTYQDLANLTGLTKQRIFQICNYEKREANHA